MRLFNNSRFGRRITAEAGAMLRVVLLPGSAIVLDDTKPPLSGKAADEVRINGDAVAELEAQAEVADIGRKRDSAEQRFKAAEERHAAAKVWKQKATADAESVQVPSRLRTVFYTICAAIALGCEFAISYQTLPPLLGFVTDGPAAGPMDRWMPVAIGAAPVAAAVVIELILDGILKALRRGRSASSWRWLPAVAGSTLGILGAAILWLNADMVWKIAAAREEASRLLTMLHQYTDTVLTINESIVTAAVVAVSITVVINAAILLQAVMEDFQHIGRHWGVMRRLRQARREAAKTSAELSMAAALFESAKRDWEGRQERANEIKKSRRSAIEFRLQQMLDRSKAPAPSLDDMISQVLVSSHVPDDVFRFPNAEVETVN